jgi:hypothetical protein
MRAHEKTTDWTVEERERIFEALEETPSFLKDLDVDGLYRMRESTIPGNPGATWRDNVVLYDKAFDSDQVLTLILDHELAHRLASTLSIEELKSFRQAAKWRDMPDGSFIADRRSEQFLRPNGRLSYMEDFCDDVAAYVQQPQKLRGISPEIFEWMERHLGPRLKKGK